MIEELRRAPATLSLAVIWVGVFVLMQMRQEHFVTSWNIFTVGAVDVQVAHEFGDATSAELAAGQLWRTVTCTLVHYSLLHLLLNLIGLVQLGLLVEHWYGSPQFLAVYLVIAAFGNALACFARPWFGISPYTHSGGGSTVVFGLIGLCAVVGWMSTLPGGRELGVWMLGFLLLNAILGFIFWYFNRRMGMHLPQFDHLAHTGGTLLGALVGLGHQLWKRLAYRPIAPAIGLVAMTVLLGCVLSQNQQSYNERQAQLERSVAFERMQLAQQAINRLVQLDLLYRMAHDRASDPPEGPRSRVFVIRGIRGQVAVPVPPAAEISKGLLATIEQVESFRDMLATGTTASAFAGVEGLAESAAEKPPDDAKVGEFERLLTVVLKRAEDELKAGQDEFTKLTRPVTPSVHRPARQVRPGTVPRPT